MMESSTIVQLMTTPCEYHQKRLCYSNIFKAETTSQSPDKKMNLQLGHSMFLKQKYQLLREFDTSDIVGF